MNRDLKIGFALGILVIGTAAVIMFGQKQEDVVPRETSREDFADVDAEIAQRPHTPHITGVESGLVSDAPSEDFLSSGKADDSPPAHDHRHTTHRPSSDAGRHDEVAMSSGNDRARVEADRKRFAWEDSSTNRGWVEEGADEFSSSTFDLAEEQENYDFLNDTDEELYRDSVGDRGNVPEPISLSKTEPTKPQGKKPQLNGDWEVTSSSTAPRQEPDRSQQSLSANSGLVYIIKRGDTLSSIASRHGLRATEIFAANRNVLSDPNQLRVGTKIIIPRRRSTERDESRKDDGPVAGWSRENLREEPRDTKKQNSLFRPVSRTPFMSRTKTLSDSSSQRTYRVRPGDSLERIARKFYGDRGKASEIFQANRDQLSSPNQIRSGMTLILP